MGIVERMGYPSFLLMFGLVLAYPKLVSLSRSHLSSNPAPATVATRAPTRVPGSETTRGPGPVTTRGPGPVTTRGPGSVTTHGPGPAPVPSPYPAPTPSPAPPPGPSPFDCSEKNTIPVLITVGKKKLKTEKLCQDYCYNVGEAMYFKWKWSKQAWKRTCFCQGVGYKKKESFFSGPIMC